MIDLTASINFSNGFTIAQKAKLVSVVNDIANNSSTAQEIGAPFLEAGGTINFQYKRGAVQTDSAFTTILFDFNARQQNHIDQFGNVREFTLTELVVHELTHILLQKYDPNPTTFLTAGADFFGDPVRYTNTIMGELGQSAERPSYFSYYDTFFNSLKVGQSFTKNEEIDVAIVAQRITSGSDTFKMYDLDTSNSLDGPTRDLLIGHGERNVFTSGDMRDFLYGGGNSDVLDAGGGDDMLYGGGGGDILIGGLGNDLIKGGAGNDTIYDSIRDITSNVFRSGEDTVFGGDGKDTIYVSSYKSTAYGEANDDVFHLLGDYSRSNKAYGGDGDDTFHVRAGFAGAAYGQDGEDTFIILGNQGNSIFHGGQETDTFRFSGDSGRLTLHGDGGNDRFIGDDASNSTIFGGAGNDVISSGGSLHGGSGKNIMTGGTQGDRFWIEGIKDVVTGGGGRDTFHIDTTSGRHRITDFNPLRSDPDRDQVFFSTDLFDGSEVVTVSRGGVVSVSGHDLKLVLQGVKPNNAFSDTLENTGFQLYTGATSWEFL